VQGRVDGYDLGVARGWQVARQLGWYMGVSQLLLSQSNIDARITPRYVILLMYMLPSVYVERVYSKNSNEKGPKRRWNQSLNCVAKFLWIILTQITWRDFVRFNPSFE
jgi:hypothetical protein